MIWALVEKENTFVEYFV